MDATITRSCSPTLSKKVKKVLQSLVFIQYESCLSKYSVFATMSRKLRGRAHFVLRWKYFWHEVSYWYKSRRFDSYIGSNRQTDAWSWGTKSIWNHQTQSRLTKLYVFDMKLWLKAVTGTAPTICYFNSYFNKTFIKFKVLMQLSIQLIE